MLAPPLPLMDRSPDVVSNMLPLAAPARPPTAGITFPGLLRMMLLATADRLGASSGPPCDTLPAVDNTTAPIVPWELRSTVSPDCPKTMVLLPLPISRRVPAVIRFASDGVSPSTVLGAVAEMVMPRLAESGCSATVPPGADSAGMLGPPDIRFSVSAWIEIACPAGTAMPVGLALALLPTVRMPAVATENPPTDVVNGAVPFMPIVLIWLAVCISDTEPALPNRFPVIRLPPVCNTAPVGLIRMVLMKLVVVFNWPASVMPREPAERVKPLVETLPSTVSAPVGS